ncbi:hypothetical protein MNBD_GAMMA12-743 [hydrothermal vent metagenome]|uniref:Uncharacterized protein n=1 Tax=hydrothermal vent metagenome TaxID=652676 RepID=A0A3B0Y2W2_9ZZZZ
MNAVTCPVGGLLVTVTLQSQLSEIVLLPERFRAMLRLRRSVNYVSILAKLSLTYVGDLTVISLLKSM